MRLDLHLHTTASDGAWSPAEVVEGAAAGGLDVIAITDHDTTAGVASAREAAAAHRVEVIAGIEVSSSWQGADVHVLGYFVDPAAPSLVAYSERAGRARQERMRAMIARLADQGLEVTYASVEAAAGGDTDIIGRPHLAAALVEAGHATSVRDAFDRLIGDRSDAFVPTALLDPMEAVELVLEASGIPVWAHPPGELVEPLLPSMIEAGLRGLEVYRPRHRKAQVLRLESICRSSGLLASGGSDWHNPERSALGDFFVSADEVEGLLQAGGM